MTRTLKPLIAAALLAGLGFGAVAQPQPMQPGQPPAMARGEHRGDRARFMQERMAHRAAELKAKLQITPAQEGAWSTWTQSMRPTGPRPQRPNFVEFARMTTPQRIDRMRELRNERIARQDRRAEATKAFYAQLSPAQQKVFDEQPMGFGRGHGGKRGGHGGGMRHHRS